MINARRRQTGLAAVSARKFVSSLTGRRTMELTAWLVLPAILLVAAGCSGGSEKKPNQSTTVAQSDQGSDEEKDVAPPPVKRKLKQKAAQKPAEPEAPAASSNDVRKWKADDLSAALLRKDIQFLPAVMFYGMSKPNDAKRAQELDALLKKVGRLKDDPVPEVPLPAGVLAEVDTESLDTPAKPGAAAAPAATTDQKGGFRFRMGGRRFGPGGGGK